LKLKINNEKIDWEISKSPDIEEKIKNYPPVELHWLDKKTTIWDPSSFLKSRRLYSISKIFAGQFFLKKNLSREAQ
jgi:hypothetical protein